MLLPISDDDKKLVKPAYITWMLLAINIAVFFLQLNDPYLSLQYGAVAAEITSGQDIEESVFVPINEQESVEVPHRG